MEIDKIKLRNIVLDYMINSKSFAESFYLMFKYGGIKQKIFSNKNINYLTREDADACVEILKEFDCFKFHEDNPTLGYFEIVKIPLDYIGIGKEIVKDSVLEYIKEKGIYEMSIQEVKNAIQEKLFVGDENLAPFVLEEVMEILKEFDCFEFNNDNIIYKPTLKERLQNKFNIVIDTIRDNIGVVAVVASTIVFVGGVVGLTINGINLSEKYENSIVVDNDKEYSMKDIYVVYTVDEVHFCTKSINKITEGEKKLGQFRRGNGDVDKYYYRDEIYDYYDIKTGEKICEDHQDGFYIEELLDFYGKFDMKGRNYRIGIDEITNDIDNDYLLSRDPGLRRK